MRGSAHVTGPLGSRHGSEGWPCLGPSSRGEEKGQQRALAAPWEASPRPENAAALPTLACVTGTQLSCWIFPKEGEGRSTALRRRTPPCAPQRGSQRHGGPGRERGDTRQVNMRPRPAPCKVVAPCSDEELSERTAQAAGPPSAPHSAPEATTSDLCQGPVCTCLPSVLVAFSNNTQPNGKPGAFSVSCARGLSLSGH